MTGGSSESKIRYPFLLLGFILTNTHKSKNTLESGGYNMIAIAFMFKVNSSFLDYYHPITIPKIHNDKLRKTKLDEEKYIIVYPRGETLSAKMYYGRPGQDKEYYQLRITKQKRPDYFQIDDRLLIILVRGPYRRNYAILEYVRKFK